MFVELYHIKATQLDLQLKHLISISYYHTKADLSFKDVIEVRKLGAT